MESLMLVCNKCGRRKREIDVAHARNGRTIAFNPKQLVAVIGEEEQKLSTLPTVNVGCPECGNNLAYAWQVQTRGSDESSTQFFRCTKCNHTFREYT
jgi:DNA-directed RNA polymerase subunit M